MAKIDGCKCFIMAADHDALGEGADRSGVSYVKVVHVQGKRGENLPEDREWNRETKTKEM